MAFKTYDRNEKAILNDGNKKGNFYYFKPGKTVLRILGPYSDKGVWFKPILPYFFKLGDERVNLLSPREQGGKDPIYEHGGRLYKSGDEQLVEKAKQFRPRRKFLVNALILSDPAGTSIKDGIKVVELPAKVKEELVNYDTNVDEGYGDITNLNKGRNITIERTGEGLMVRYSVRPHVQTTDVMDLAKEHGVDVNSWTLPNLDETAVPATQEELQEVLDRVLAMDAPIAMPVTGGSVMPQMGEVNTGTTPLGYPVDTFPSTNLNPVGIPDLPPPPWENQ